MPTLSGVLETSLYVADLDRAEQFYAAVLGLARIHQDERLRGMSVAGRQVLLLFRQGASLERKTPHDGHGPVHLAFAIAADQWDAWVERLATAGVPIEDEIHWDRGGRSLYFRDPDGHLLELVTPGCWTIY